MKLKVWLLQNGEPLSIFQNQRKLRTAILADFLVARGHEVLWWTSAFEHQRKIWISKKDRNYILNPNYTIRAIRGLGYRNNISFRRYLDHLIVAKKFKQQSTKYERPNIIVASMPCHQLAYEGMCYAKTFHIPLIVDIRDLWPDIFIKPLKKLGLDKFGKKVLTRDFWKASQLLRNADSLVAVSEGYLNWGLKKGNRSLDTWDRVLYHGYFNDKRNIGSPSLPFKELDRKKIFLFVGTFGRSYELNLIVDVAKRLIREKIDDVIFCIAGTGEQFDSLNKSADTLPNIFLPGWVDADTIKKLLENSWAGIVPCVSAKDTVPNKVFEYLSAGLPLISSLEGEIAEMTKKYQIGLNYKAEDVEGLYRCVRILSTNERLRNNMSAAAEHFYSKYGDADQIYNDYADFIEELYKNINNSAY